MMSMFRSPTGRFAAQSSCIRNARSARSLLSSINKSLADSQIVFRLKIELCQILAQKTITRVLTHKTHTTLFDDGWPDWPEDKYPIPGHGLTGPTGSYTPDGTALLYFSLVRVVTRREGFVHSRYSVNGTALLYSSLVRVTLREGKGSFIHATVYQIYLVTV